MAGAKPKTISSLAEMVEYVQDNCDPDHILFRGQPSDWPLLPKIARPRFHTRGGSRLAVEKEMFDEFRRQALPYLEIAPASDWDWLAIAQHHGMPTRLLDWTLNPLAALWFAVERAPETSDPGVVWLFEAEKDDYIDSSKNTDPFATSRTRVFRPRHVTRRIVSQNGWFTAHKYLDSKSKFVPLEKNKTFKNRLRKLSIPTHAFADIRRELDRFGINSASLYGGIDGLCKHIEWLHSFLPDEETIKTTTGTTV